MIHEWVQAMMEEERINKRRHKAEHKKGHAQTPPGAHP